MEDDQRKTMNLDLEPRLQFLRPPLPFFSSVSKLSPRSAGPELGSVGLSLWPASPETLHTDT